MDKKLSPIPFLISVLISVLVLLSSSIIVPQDRYHRYQAYNSITTQKADWIYERLRFDPTPIDVALIGTSRTGGGLSAPMIENIYCGATGRKIHVSNLSIPKTGRNMHYTIAKEAINAKNPSLIIIELNEVEPRKPHNEFIFLADATDVLTAPIAINLNYISDIVRLPGRQMQLFYEGMSGRPALRNKFSPAAYAGTHLDRTQTVTLIDGQIISRDVEIPRQELEALRAQRLLTQKPLFVLPGTLQNLEYRFSRYYLHKIETRAKEAGAAVDYVYLPAYRSHQQFPPILKRTLGLDSKPHAVSPDVAINPTLWMDATHVNAQGARIQSDAFAKSLSNAHPNLGVPDKSCAIRMAKFIIKP